MANETFGTTHRPTMAERFWKSLGYGHRYDEAFIDWRCEDPEEGDWWVPGALTTRTIIHVDWRDRLRILISGRCCIVAASRTDVQVNRAETRSRFAVLHPEIRSGHGERSDEAREREEGNG